MKYLEKSFTSPANSKAYVDNWERVFGEQAEPAKICPDCGATPPDPCEKWCSTSGLNGSD